MPRTPTEVHFKMHRLDGLRSRDLFGVTHPFFFSSSLSNLRLRDDGGIRPGESCISALMNFFLYLFSAANFIGTGFSSQNLS